MQTELHGLFIEQLVNLMYFNLSLFISALCIIAFVCFFSEVD